MIEDGKPAKIIDCGQLGLFSWVRLKSKEDQLSFNFKDDKVAESNLMVEADFNGENCWMRRIEKKCVTGLTNERFIKENKPLHTFQYHVALYTPNHFHLVYRESLITLQSYMQNVNWDWYTCKSILHKYCSLMKYFHKNNLTYGNENVFKDIFIDVGVSDNFSIKLSNFFELKYVANKENKSVDIKAFASFLICLLNRGTPRRDDVLESLPHSRDRSTILDLLRKIESRSITSFGQILCHPLFWKNRKIIDFITRVYTLANRDHPAISINTSQLLSGYCNWHTVFDKRIYDDALKTMEWATNKPPEGQLQLKDVNVFTFTGLVSYMRNTCGPHFCHSRPARKFLGSPPRCINKFLYELPSFLIDLYQVTMNKSISIISELDPTYSHLKEEILIVLSGFLPEE